MKVNIAKKDKAEVLAALYNAARPLGMGFLQYDPKPMTVDEAREILEVTADFDYLHGRVMKVDLSGNEFESWLYDRDNGDGRAEAIVSKLPDVK